ncbi:MAG: hypothetical protein BRD51_01005, partial [Bacteroidetes bacterium SW_11_64_17]
SRTASLLLGNGDGDPDMLVTGLTPTTRSASSIVYENLLDNPIPVELAGFEGTATEEGARLTWQTASESGNAGFEVQRKTASGPTSGWTKVGFVESKAAGGTTSEARSYRFEDKEVPFAADRLEYRLRQVDLDGSETLTDPVQVERTVRQLRLQKPFPNPARGRATVRFAVPERQNVSLELYDVLGRTVQTVAETGQTRTQKLTIMR